MARTPWRFGWMQRQPYYPLAIGVFGVLGPVAALFVFFFAMPRVLVYLTLPWPLAVQTWAIALVSAYKLGILPALIIAVVIETLRAIGLRPVWLVIVAAAVGAAVTLAWHSAQIAASEEPGFTMIMTVVGAVPAVICAIVLLLTIRWTDAAT
ncbi:MAG: hypothetical protein KDJ86_10190 [Bauldia sp.]|uniref:hypothetical protein n=1 Tax=Bauldia sp. TaxID=2575872 RepID=UPI001DDFE24F|nr:hypothetical protein [Bauldia sp.]MCB1496144.1 hypothetical protein [Bauldia sp.]